MSHQNKLRFLLCLLFSAIAHSGVLIASMMMGSQIQEAPTGASEKLATTNESSPKTLGVTLAKNLPQLPTVLPSKKAPREQTLELVDLPAEKAPILLAKEDAPQAVEIEKPKPVIKTIKPKIAPKKKKQTKVAKQELPKKQKKSNETEVLRSDEKLVAVKEKVDAEAGEAQPQESISEAPPVVSENQADPEVETEIAAETPQATQMPADQNGQAADGDSVSAGAGETANHAPAASPGGSSKGIRDGDSLAEMNGNRRPNYPIEDRRAKREGIAIFTARVTADGRVQDIQLESAATPSMNAAAQKAFANYRYKPGQEGRIRKKFVFKINGELEEAGGLRRIPDRNSQKTSQN